MTVCGAGTFQFKSGPGPNTMSQEDLEELNLKPGLNEGRYVCPELGEVLLFSVFLYSEDQKLVLTDIDGTITESDVRVRIVSVSLSFMFILSCQGQVLPKLGITAQHAKVVELFDKIDKNGYGIVYLTARLVSKYFLG